MIVTVTPNPSLDRTYQVPGLVRGALLRAATDRVDPGGKGVNVSRALAAAGHETIAVLPLGGAEGEFLAGLLAAQGIDLTAVRVGSPTRVNISVAEPDGTLTKINAAGPELTADESEAFLATVCSQGASVAADWIACCGSLPPGLAPGWYADLVTRAHATGARVALDTAGLPLTAALPAGPDLVKPNRDELAEAVGRPLVTLGDVIKAADELRDMGAGAVLASLGAGGMVLVEEGGTWYGTAPAETVRSDVGAGDASLSGFLLAGGTGEVALASALAHGAAAVQLPGSAMPTPADLVPGAVRTLPVRAAASSTSASSASSASASTGTTGTTGTNDADIPLDRPLG